MVDELTGYDAVALGEMIRKGEISMDVARSFNAFTRVQNITGQPAMSVPLYWNYDNIPIGVHFAGRFGDDGLLFRLAAQLEQARPWADQIPPIHCTHI